MITPTPFDLCGELRHLSVQKLGNRLLKRACSLLITASLPLLTSCLLLFSCAAKRAEPKNLVVICIDTVRYDVFHLPERIAYRDTLSPWMKQALVFDRAQSPAPWTVPAVASLLTGLYPNQHGAGYFKTEVANLDKSVPTGILAGVPTLPELLKEQGYETAAFVAHPWFQTSYGMDRGFNTLVLQKHSDKVSASALDWLRRRRSGTDALQPKRPFLLYLHFMEAHENYRRAEVEVLGAAKSLPRAVSAATLQAAPGRICADRQTLLCQRFLAYTASVMELRRTLASLLDQLRKDGLLREAVIVLYSDHGEEFRDHFEEGKARGTDPRQIFGIGHGHTLYQELLHVPFVIWHPGLEGRNVEIPVSLVDLLPSLIDWFDLHRQEGVRYPGVALESLLSQGKVQRLLFSSGIAYGPPQAAILSEPWKIIRGADSEAALIFQLSQDPGEKKPVEGVDPALLQKLANYRAFRPETIDAGQDEIPPDVLERLQSLGYLEGVKSNN